MTDALEILTDRLHGAFGKLEKFVIDAAERNADLIEDLNREQLRAGIRSDNTEITPPYSPVTVAIKKKKGQVFTRVTLQDKSDYHQSLKVRRFGNKLQVEGQDWKTPELQEKYGDEIEGLTPDNIAEVSQFIKPEVQRDLRNYFHT